MEVEEDDYFQEFDILYEKLNGDILLLEKLLATENSDSWRRSYCRAIFALIEATAACIKRFTLHCYYPGMLSKSEKNEIESRQGALQGFFIALDLFAKTSGAEGP